MTAETSLMQITIPELSLVLLIGSSGCGKSTFARKHFRATEVLSSDFFRGLICDDESEQAANRDAFEAVHLLTAKRLAWRRFTVLDATNLKAESRRPLLGLARRYHYLTTAIVFDLPAELCKERNRLRAERQVPESVIDLHSQTLQQTINQLQHDRFDQVWILDGPDEVENAEIRRLPMPFERSSDHGPFDLVGDVHGCFDELKALLELLGYAIEVQVDLFGERWYRIRGPADRKLVFVGDLIDRGPRSAEVLRLVMNLVEAGLALCVTGNHDDKLRRHLEGRDVAINHGLNETISQIRSESEYFKNRVRAFLEDLPTHYLLDHGKLVVAHAGLREDLQGRESKRVRAFALYGETTGGFDSHGLPIRGNWGMTYTGPASVVHGHTPVAVPSWHNRTLNIDTGCVFGGRLTALRYPEGELVSVPARRIYCVAPRPFLPAPPPAPRPAPPSSAVAPETIPHEQG
jgi:protein phosphatase